ncbi:MAG TPA: homocysteine biosynthesis protein [Clostridia bacterium]|nr:homocysteine biosynthesis protein [Clostridia bacterium]
MAIQKTYEEINEKIKSGKVVVATAEEIIPMVKEKGLTKTAQEVDVVTTGTFSPMCSSGAFLSLGHSTPRMKMSKIWLNDVPAYGGIAAVDAYVGATELRDNDPGNRYYPGEFEYGGAHVIHDLVAGRKVKLRATAYGTDCYPRRQIETNITINDINEAVLFNPRNAYQNYSCAINLSDRVVYTYMGMLKPRLGNANYSTSGRLSPLLKDPNLSTVGMGTRIFLGGGVGYVAWHGTQHFPEVLNDNGKELCANGGTLAVIGDLKQMKPEWLVGYSITGYGASLSVGIGIPIPILNEDILRYAAVDDNDLYAPVIDYGEAYPNGTAKPLAYVSYAELKSGKIKFGGKEIPSAPLSSYPKAREIANSLKDWIKNKGFELTKPVKAFPSAKDNITVNSLKIRNNEA